MFVFYHKEATDGDFAAVWKKIDSNRERYLVEYNELIETMFSLHKPSVVIKDYSAAILDARRLGYCNWGVLDEHFMPLGYGIALPEDSPFVQYFNDV